MKTPDEIKKGLECCVLDDYPCGKGCPYKKQCLTQHRYEEIDYDALAYIKQLEAHNAELIEKVEKLKTERDAAVETIYEMSKCITEDVCEWCDGVECERLCMQHTILRPGFKWRGVQKEE